MCWDDPHRAEAEVQHAVELASSRSVVAGLPLVSAGFSQGAGLAIALAARRAALLGTAGVAVIVLSNVPGLRDGIADESWPLAIWVGLSGLYALGVAGLVLYRAVEVSR